MDPRGVPRWISDVLPGHLNDLTSARELVLAIVWPYTKVRHEAWCFLGEVEDLSRFPVAAGG
jgi:hypothetical protein